MGDHSQAIYQQINKNRYKLICIINPESAKENNNVWPEEATSEEINRWKSSVRYKRVEKVNNFETPCTCDRCLGIEEK